MNARLISVRQQQAIAPPAARKPASPAPTVQAGMPYFLQAKTNVQREESSSLPPLTPPQPFGAKKAGLLGDTPQLKLDPQIQLYLIEMLFAKRLDGVTLRAALRGALQAPATLKTTPATVITPPSPTTPPVTSPAPTVQTPPAKPGTPPAPLPQPPRPGEVGDVIDAATSAAAPVLEPMKAQLFSQLKQGWASFSTVERVGVVSFGVGTVSLAGIGAFSNPDARSFLLDKLNGAVIPVPGAGWLGLETHIGGDSLFFGAHLDVGRLLPEAMGFGPGDFNSITSPKPAYVPQRRADDTGLLRIPADASARIAAAQSGGSALPLAARARMESGLGADLSQVRVHTDSEADALARDLAANAFTSGAHIFMRAGQYHPDSTAGLRLLAHEAAHTLQQASGPVNGVPVGGGIALSQPGDAFESAADQAADRVVGGARAPASADWSAASRNPSGAPIQRKHSPAGSALGPCAAPTPASAVADKVSAAQPAAAPGLPLFLQREPGMSISGPARAAYPSKGWLSPTRQTGTQFDSVLTQFEPAKLMTIGGREFVYAEGKADLLITLTLGITWQDFNPDWVDAEGKKPFRRLRLNRSQREAGKWTDAEKTAYRQNLRASIESAWSAKHDFILKDDMGATINRTRVCVRVDFSEAGRPAHYQIVARKLPPAIKPEQEIRSWVSPGSHTAVLDSTDEDPTEFTQMSGAAYMRRVGPFAQGSAAITSDLDTQIEPIARHVHSQYPNNLPADAPGPALDFTGRASAEGGTLANRALGEKRAENVATRVSERVEALGTSIDVLTWKSRGEENASTDPEFRRVDVYFNPLGTATGTRTTAAHEAGHMFGLDDEYVEESAPYKRFAGDRPEHAAKVAALMGTAAAEELSVQDSNSIMSRGDVVRAGHYVFFLEALNTLSQHTWQVAAPSANPCTLAARTP